MLECPIVTITLSFNVSVISLVESPHPPQHCNLLMKVMNEGGRLAEFDFLLTLSKFRAAKDSSLDLHNSRHETTNGGGTWIICIF